MPLTAAQLEKFKQKLLSEREQIGKHVRDTVGHGADAHGDSGDCSTSLAGAEFAFGLEEHEHELLRDIEVALRRIEDGTYGVCDECGEEIPLARLDAIPTAHRTAGCQERVDRETGNGFRAERGQVLDKWGADS